MGERRLDEIASGEVHELIGAAEHVGRELRDGGEYGRWLQDSFAPLKVSDDSVIRALAGLRAPIATTNYDNLIEQVTGLGAVTWRDTARFGRVARGELTGVLHLHGYYEDPESVVFGIRDYEQVLRDEHAQAVQQAFTLMRTLLLVGFGGGFDDPNFEELRKWMGKALHGSDHRHYRLALDGEAAALQRLHRHERIFALGYGPSHADLAPFLSALAPSRPPPIEVPPEPPPPPTPDPSPPPSPEPSTHRPVVAAVAVALRRRVGGRRRSVPAWALLALVVALVGGLLVARAVTPGLGSTVGACSIPLELIVLTTPTKEARLRELAVDFGDQAPGPCRRSSITVFSVASSSAVVGALAAGWPPDDLRLGPQPAVWLPDAAAEVERVNQELGGQKLASLGSIATSAVVLAVPRSAMAKLGQAGAVAWPTMVDWARRAAPHSRVRIGRPDPTSSTAGLLATIGLHGTATRSATSDAQRHAVEQTIDPIGDELTGLCEVAGEDGGPSRAVIVPEQAMVAYNRGVDFGGPCQPGQPRASDQLQAVYPADGTPVLDHPFVLLPAAVETGDRERLARDFFAYVMAAPAQRKLREAGYRDRDRRFGETISEDDGVRIHQLPRWAAAPDGATLAGQLDAWQRARVPARGYQTTRRAVC